MQLASLCGLRIRLNSPIAPASNPVLRMKVSHLKALHKRSFMRSSVSSKQSSEIPRFWAYNPYSYPVNNSPKAVNFLT